MRRSAYVLHFRIVVTQLEFLSQDPGDSQSSLIKGLVSSRVPGCPSLEVAPGFLLALRTADLGCSSGQGCGIEGEEQVLEVLAR